MEYLYAAMLLHSAGQKIEEASLSKVLKSAGAAADTAKVKAIVSALQDVDIDKAIATQAVPVVAAAPEAAKAEEPAKAEEVKEEEKKEDEEIGGLGALFG